MNKNFDINKALSAFFKDTPSYCQPYGNGHINDTFLVVADKRYIMQRMNTDIFPCTEKLMENILGVTEHIRKKTAELHGDVSRSTLAVCPTLSGLPFFRDSDGNCWRVYEFTEGTVSLEAVRSKEDFYNCAEAFGRFQQLLSDYPAEELYSVIPNFHNTPVRYNNLINAIKKDTYGRLAEVSPEVDFVKARESFCHTLEHAFSEGTLPLRVTHNDTKLNNILFDEKSGEAICVIDLDTVMPGYSVNDFGDSIRFGANTAAEDETDLSKVSLDLDLFEAYAKGFIKGCGGKLTEKELELLPVGAMMMTLECGMRFLTDYLEGDVYFKTHRQCHNLDRARAQFALVADMERKKTQMDNIILKLKTEGRN
ncbi:MAG: aminoglycoside phosphotransferase family protein [Ruminococcaceae bacterium]|nr:aminoglycoside phosphotransferase family protein [Oscillospiraceae bacterium]